MNKIGPVIRRLFALTAVFLFLLSGGADAASSGGPVGGFIISVFGTVLTYRYKDNTVRLTAGGVALLAGKEWEARAVSPNVFRLKNRKWDRFFWEVDAAARRVYEVKGKTLNDPGERKELAGVSVEVCGDTTPDYVYLKFSRASLHYNRVLGGALMETRSDVISNKEDWEVKEVDRGVFQFKNRLWKEIFWKVDMTTWPKTVPKKVWGDFGFPGGREMAPIESGVSADAPFNRVVGVEGGKTRLTAKFDNPQDARMAALLAEDELKEKPIRPNHIPPMHACFNPMPFRGPVPRPGFSPSWFRSYANPGDLSAGFIANLYNVDIEYTSKDNSVGLEEANRPVSVKGEWEARPAGAGIFRLKNRRWDGFFWEVDSTRRTVYEVKGKTLDDDGKKTPVEGVWVDACGYGAPEKVYLRFFNARLHYDKDSGALIESRSTVLSFREDWEEVKRPHTDVYQFRNRRLKEDGIFLEVNTNYSPGNIMHANIVSGGVFGTLPAERRLPVGSRIVAEAPYDRVASDLGGKARMKSEKPTDVAMAERRAESAEENRYRFTTPPALHMCYARSFPIIMPQRPSPSTEDLGFARKPVGRPESAWMESEKALYEGILKKGSYDVLVVPVQVQGYAFDPANRSLMTRYLSAGIEDATGLRVPDPTLVSRALGRRARTFSPRDVYRIANELKARYVIMAYAGHALDEKMRLTLLVLTRRNDGTLEELSDAAKLEWKDVPFSDDDPPAEAFNGMLDGVVSKLPIPKRGKPSVSFYGKQSPAVPADVFALFRSRPATPVLSAYYLQFIGLLYPEDVDMEKDIDNGREDLFERSLVALNAVSDKSPDYALLKARAYFYLRSRPAALAALKDPNTPEEKAFLAFLDGNLPEMEKWTGRIGPPLERLMSEMELISLKSDYEQYPRKKELKGLLSEMKPISLKPDDARHRQQEGLQKTAEGLSPWAPLVLRRVVGKDPWSREPNLLVKKMLDVAFPVSGFSADDVARGQRDIGESLLGPRAELSVYRHWRRVIEDQGKKFCCADGSARPVELDFLDLLYSTGEANLWKHVRLLANVQGLYSEAKGELDSLEGVYGGNLEFTYLKKIVLSRLKKNADASQARFLQKAIDELDHDACYWSKAQSPIAQCALNEGYYDHDYPRHFMWKNSMSDRMTLKKRTIVFRPIRFDEDVLTSDMELSLLYTHDDFGALQSYHSFLYFNKGLSKEADALLEANKDRFVGNPARVSYLSYVLETKGKLRDAMRLNEQAIAEDPDAWPPYKKLGKLYIEDGQVSKAYELYRKYPPLTDPKADGVRMANIAYETGLSFFRIGAEKDASHFFKLSASYDTGAAAEMASAMVQAMYDGDYNLALRHAFEHVQRYGTETGYVPYMELLDLTGRHDDARSVMKASNLSPNLYNLVPGFVDYRMEGKTEEEYLKTFSQEYPRMPYLNTAEAHLTMSIFLDRAPDKSLIEAARAVERRYSPKGSYYTLLEYGYYLLKTKEYKKAYADFDAQFRKNADVAVLPYLTWSGIKAGHLDDVREKLKAWKKKTNGNEGFPQYLSDAMVSGSTNDVAEAVLYLDLARCNIETIWNFPFPRWYELVEATEWLYEDTGNDTYRELAVQYAKMHERILPMMGWAYAVEAKYSKPGPERLRALALTLYLDRRSERISKFSEKEKQEAQRWLEKNNPFTKRRKEGPTS